MPADPRRVGDDLIPACTPEPMTQARFLDRWRHFNGEPQQVSGASMLFDAISQGWPAERILDEQAAWARKFSEKPPAPPEPTWPVEFDPAGGEEAGMAGPKKKALMGPNDTYLLVNDRDEDMEAFDGTGKLLWRIPCLARGQGGDREWQNTNTDTPPGLYKCGAIYRDYDQVGKSPAYDGTLQSYGWYSIDLEEQEGQEARYGRAGIMIHGGGSACGWPDAWNPRQALHPTLGCIRVHNEDLRDRIVPACDKGTVWVGVWQEQ